MLVMVDTWWFALVFLGKIPRGCLIYSALITKILVTEKSITTLFLNYQCCNNNKLTTTCVAWQAWAPHGGDKDGQHLVRGFPNMSTGVASSLHDCNDE